MTRKEAKILTYMANNGFKVHYNGGFTDEIIYLRHNKKTNKYMVAYYNPAYGEDKDLEKIDLNRFIISRPVSIAEVKKMADDMPNAVKDENIMFYIDCSTVEECSNERD